MFTGQVDVISNKATWRSKIYELEDDDGTTTDLSDPALTVDIVVTIKSLSSGSCCAPYIYATASLTNSKASIPGPGFEWQFEVSDLSNLCAGTYGLGAKVTIDGFVQDVIDGTLAVVEGN